MESSGGRQNIARLCQYFCKFIYILLGTQYWLQLQITFKNILKWHNLFKTSFAIERFTAYPVKGNIFFQMIRLLNNSFNFFWRLADDLSLLKLINFLPAKNSTITSICQIIAWTDWFWLLTLFTDIILQFIALNDTLLVLYQIKKLNMTTTKEKKIKKSKTISDKLDEKNLKKLTLLCQKYIRIIFFKSLDVCIVLNKLQITNSNDLLISVFGISTSIEKISSIWSIL